MITYTGADQRTSARARPPCRSGSCSTRSTPWRRRGPPGREHVVVRHPLQPFDARNFPAGAGRPFSFDPAALAGARAPAPGRRRRRGSDGRCPRRTAASRRRRADDLVRFLEHPARAFLRQRLAITSDEDDEPADALAVDLDGLQWAVGDRLLPAGWPGRGRTCLEASGAGATCRRAPRRPPAHSS